jgi:hypothetical protein
MSGHTPWSQIKRTAADRRYRETHRTQRRAYDSAYRGANRLRRRSDSRAYYWRTKAAALAKKLEEVLRGV